MRKLRYKAALAWAWIKVTWRHRVIQPKPKVGGYGIGALPYHRPGGNAHQRRIHLRSYRRSMGAAGSIRRWIPQGGI